MRRSLVPRFGRTVHFFLSLCPLWGFLFWQTGVPFHAIAQEGSGPAGVFQDPNKTLQWNISGVEVGKHRFSPANRYWTAVDTKVVSRTVTFSGTLRAAVAPNAVTYGSLSAWLRAGDQIKEVQWPDRSKGEDGLMGQGMPFNEKQLSFSLTLDVPPGTPVSAEATAGISGGVSEFYRIHLDCEPMAVNSAPQPSEEQSSPQEEDGDLAGWVILVGGGAAALAAAAASIARSRARSRSRNGKEPRPTYILQLSTKKISLKDNAPSQLAIKAWKVGSDGTPLPAPEAAIRLTVAPPLKGITVTPDSGAGSLVCAVSAADCLTACSGRIEVSASAGAKEIADFIDVEVSQEYKLEFFWESH